MTVSFYGFGDEDPWREVDGWRRRHVREVWQVAETLNAMTYVTRGLIRVLDRSVASSSVHSTYKNLHFSFHFSTLRKNFIVRASPSLVRASPSLVRAQSFTSFCNEINPFAPFFGKWSYPSLYVPSVFIIVMVEALNFLHPSLPLFLF